MDGRTDGWMDGLMDGWMDKCKCEKVFVVSQMYEWMDIAV